VIGIRLLDKLLEQGHCSAKPLEAHPLLAHTFRITLGHGIPVCGEVVQTGKADDLKGLACSHGRAQGDLVPKDRPMIFTSAEGVTALSFGFRAIRCARSDCDPARVSDRLNWPPARDLDLDFADRFASSARSDLPAQSNLASSLRF
jgi:hypothetical protein